MGLRISGGPNRGIRNAAPRNYGRANKYFSVQDQVDNIIGRANEQYIEALNVDGVQFQYWHRTTEGRYCTCQNPTAEQAPHLQNMGDRTNTDANNQQGDGSSLPDSDGSPVSFKVRGARDRREVVDTVNLENVLGVTVGDNADGNQTKEINNDLGSDASLTKAMDDDAFVRMGSDAGILFGGERTQCGICFGTGYVGGYSLFCGKREIFDASGTYDFSLFKFSLDNKQNPAVFRSATDSTAYVQWTYELPTYFIGCTMIHVRDNVKSVANSQVLYQIVGSSAPFAPLTIDFVNSCKGVPTKLLLRVGPAQSKLEVPWQFTHMEFVLQFDEWPKMQIAALGETTNFGVFNSLITTSMMLPPNLPQASKEDVIYEFKYNDLWKVTTATDSQTAKLQVMAWNVDTRIIQDFEQLALLRLSAQRSFEMDYSGLKNEQGIAIASADQFIDVPVTPPSPISGGI
jgi:hypothetical protein